MALSKIRKDKKGIETQYERVVGVVVDYENQKTIVSIKRYVSDEIRSVEKEFDTHNKSHQSKYARLDELMKIEERTPEINDEIIKLSNEINEMCAEDKTHMQDLALDIITQEIEFSSDADLSQPSIYNSLKKLDEYKDSKDI